MTFSPKAIEAAARAICVAQGYDPKSLDDIGSMSHLPLWKDKLAAAQAALTAALAVDGMALQGWQPIESAPKGCSILLAVAGTAVPIYCGRQRYGNLGEPQQDVFAWRCDSSGRFASPTHWQPLPPPPAASDREERRLPPPGTEG